MAEEDVFLGRIMERILIYDLHWIIVLAESVELEFIPSSNQECLYPFF